MRLLYFELVVGDIYNLLGDEYLYYNMATFEM